MSLRFTNTLGRWRFKFCDWAEEDKSWVLLYGIDGKDVLRAWSSCSLDAQSREALIKELTLQSNEVRKEYDLLDIFLGQASVWSYWGSGIPSPIAGYFDSELKHKLHEHSAI